MKDRAVVLLSGGMDSSTALYWAAARPNTEVVAIAHFDYGQLGADYEANAALMVMGSLASELGHVIPFQAIKIDGYGLEAITSDVTDLRPGVTDKYGNPSSFVPGRNLFQLARTLPLLYKYDAHMLVGGWVEQDVEYPDCRQDFLEAFADTAVLALGGFEVTIAHPLITLTKAEIVELGRDLGVPWEHTRSCYRNDEQACGTCDSCLLRAAAFWANDMHDPAYDLDGMRRVVSRCIDAGYIEAE